jgi:hypothetical protein
MPQLPKAEQQMNNQLQEEPRWLKHLAFASMPEAPLETGFQVEHLKEFLEYNKPRKGRESLILELQSRNRCRFCPHVFSARLHHLTSVFFAVDVMPSKVYAWRSFL